MPHVEGRLASEEDAMNHVDCGKLIAEAREIPGSPSNANEYLIQRLAAALEATMRERDWHRDQEAGLRDDIVNLEAERDASDRAFRALKSSTGQADSERIDLKRQIAKSEALLAAALENAGQGARTDVGQMAEVAEQAGDEWQTMFDQFMLGRGADPGPLYPFIARALCEVHKEGKLT